MEIPKRLDLLTKKISQNDRDMISLRRMLDEESRVAQVFHARTDTSEDLLEEIWRSLRGDVELGGVEWDGVVAHLEKYRPHLFAEEKKDAE